MIFPKIVKNENCVTNPNIGDSIIDEYGKVKFLNHNREWIEVDFKLKKTFQSIIVNHDKKNHSVSFDIKCPKCNANYEGTYCTKIKAGYKKVFYCHCGFYCDVDNLENM